MELGDAPRMPALLHDVLGQLEGHLLRVEALLRQHGVDVLDQVGMPELPGGEVYIERQRLRAFAAAALEFAAGLA